MARPEKESERKAREFSESLRRPLTPAEKARGKRATREAWESLFYLVIGIVVLIVVAVALYVAWLIISALPIPVAILIGAVIIGFCILAAR